MCCANAESVVKSASISPDVSAALILPGRTQSLHYVTESLSSSRWLTGQESSGSAGDAGDAGSISESGRSPGGGHGSPLQYSCWENPIDRGTWWTVIHGVAKSRTEATEHACAQRAHL